MLFIHTWRQVLAGSKTLTTRRAYRNAQGELEPCRYQVGKTYAVQQGRGMCGIAQIVVTEVFYAAQARAISDADARAEGFTDAADYIAQAAGMFGEKYLARECYRIRFKKVDQI